MQPIVRQLGLVDYVQSWQKMQAYTNTRDANSNDEIWVLQHPAVFTLGKNIKREHLLTIKNIPVIESDRGGQVTYHAPGQLIVYLLLNLKRLKIGPRQLVNSIEKSIIDLLAQYKILAVAKKNAPGVYVKNEKIAALGLRIRKGYSFHGLALNVNMNLTPFNDINPCGYQGLKVTQIKNFIETIQLEAVAEKLVQQLIKNLPYDEHN